jgi:polysaccharide biosynthesis/export protein
MACRTKRGGGLLMMLFACLLGVGCLNRAANGPQGPGGIVVPPAGSVPNELSAVSLPEYVIEPPDVLQIEAVLRKVKEKPKGRDGADKPEAKAPVEYTDETAPLPIHPIAQQFQVQPDGFVHLGAYGSVPVTGLTVNQARLAIRAALAKQIDVNAGGKTEDALIVIVSVVQYNSKTYTVITDGGGNGERVYKMPITGKEFVTDAIANIGGLPIEASKRNIWVARRTPELNEQQILPVDWVGISQWGVASTNYQIFPGDRVYVKAQRLVTVDNTLAKMLAPVQQLFGVTLLGTQTVNQAVGRGIGFGGTGN